MKVYFEGAIFNEQVLTRWLEGWIIPTQVENELFFYKHVGSGLSLQVAYIFNVVGSQSCLIV